MAENFYTYDHQVLFSFSNPGLIELSTAGLVMKIKLIKKWMPVLEIASLTSGKKMDYSRNWGWGRLQRLQAIQTETLFVLLFNFTRKKFSVLKLKDT